MTVTGFNFISHSKCQVFYSTNFIVQCKGHLDSLSRRWNGGKLYYIISISNDLGRHSTPYFTSKENKQKGQKILPFWTNMICSGQSLYTYVQNSPGVACKPECVGAPGLASLGLWPQPHRTCLGRIWLVHGILLESAFHRVWWNT